MPLCLDDFPDAKNLGAERHDIPYVVVGMELRKEQDDIQVEEAQVCHSYWGVERNARVGLHNDLAGQGEGLAASHDNEEEEEEGGCESGREDPRHSNVHQEEEMS